LSGAQEEIIQDGYYIHAFKVNHNVTCYGYSISIPRKGRFSPEHARELEIPLPFWRKLQNGETVTDGERTYTPDMVMGAPRKGIKVTYCTDSRPLPVIAEHAKDADLFICEGMYAEKEKLEKAKQYKHMTFYEAAQMAAQANPKEMWLTHFSPSLVKAESYMDEVRTIFRESYLGKDGKSVELDFEED
jgi:ribonuclease Z